MPQGVRVAVAPDAAGLAELAGAGLDLLVDTVGGPDLAAALPALRPGGRVAIVGYVGGLVAELPLPLLLGTDVRLLPVNGLRHEARSFERAPALLAELASGRVRLDVRTHPVERIDEALSDRRHGGGGRVAVLL